MDGNFSSLRPSAPVFRFSGGMPVGAAPAYNRVFISNQPPMHMQYAFHPGNPIPAQVGNPQYSWPPVQLIQQHHPATFAGVGLMHASVPAVTDKTLTAFQERAKKCGITIEPDARKSLAAQNDMIQSDFSNFKIPATNNRENKSLHTLDTALRDLDINMTMYGSLPKMSGYNISKELLSPGCVNHTSPYTGASNEIDLTTCGLVPESSDELITGLTQQNLPNVDSREAGCVNKSWSINDGSEIAEGYPLFFNAEARPASEEPHSVVESDGFSEAVKRWRMSRRGKDASCQTPVVMTVSACVGTVSKVSVDSSTNTILTKTKLYVDVATNTENEALNVAKSRNSFENMMASEPHLHVAIPKTNQLDYVQASVLSTNSPARKEKQLNKLDNNFIERGKSAANSSAEEVNRSEPLYTTQLAEKITNGHQLVSGLSRIQGVHSSSEDEPLVDLKPALNEACLSTSKLSPVLLSSKDHASICDDVDIPCPSENDDVYYSDEESPDSPPASGMTSMATDLPLDQQQLVNQMVIQMILVNPSLASCNPVVLQDLAVRYLISTKLVNKPPSLLDHSPLLKDQGNPSGERYDHPESQVGENLPEIKNKLHVLPNEVPLGRMFSGASRHTVEDFHCKSTDEDYEQHGLAKNSQIPPRGRGRSTSSSIPSMELHELRQQGRGRGRGEHALPNQPDGMHCFKLLNDKSRPGATQASKVSLHPPVFAATCKVPSQPHDTQSSFVDWDSEPEEFMPKLSCFKTH